MVEAVKDFLDAVQWRWEGFWTDTLPRNIAWRLPPWVFYWAVIHAFTEKFSTDKLPTGEMLDWLDELAPDCPGYKQVKKKRGASR